MELRWKSMQVLVLTDKRGGTFPPRNTTFSLLCTSPVLSERVSLMLSGAKFSHPK